MYKEEEEGRRGAREEEEEEGDPEKESPSFDDLLSGGCSGGALSNKCSNLLLPPTFLPSSPVYLSHSQFLLAVSALALGVAVWCVFYFFAS